MKNLLLVLSLVVVAAVCQISSPTIAYKYTPRISFKNTVSFRSNPIRSHDTAAFFLVYDDDQLNQTYIQPSNPVSPLWRPYAPVSLSSIGIFPGSLRIFVSPVFNGRAAVLAWFEQTSWVVEYAYYNASAGTVYKFPGQPFTSLAFGNEEPWWNGYLERVNGLLSDHSRYLYALSGCNAANPNTWIVSQFDPWQLIQNSHLTWSQTVYTSNCSNPPSFQVYEETVWLVTGGGRVIHLDSNNGTVLYNESNPCGFVGTGSLELWTVNIGVAKDHGVYGLPMYAFILTNMLANKSLEMCRISHRSYTVEWKFTVPWNYRQNQWTTYGIASGGATAFMIWWGTNGNDVGEITFVDPVLGKPLFPMPRSEVDYLSYPTAIMAPIGGCQNPMTIQISGLLTLLCMDTVTDNGFAVLWTSQAACEGWAITNPMTTVAACNNGYSVFPFLAQTTLVSLVDGSILWQTAAEDTYLAPFVADDLVWYFQGKGSLVASPFTAYQPPQPAPQAATPEGSSGVSSGTAAAVSILMLVVGAVLGVVLFTQVYQKRLTQRATYGEIQSMT